MDDPAEGSLCWNILGPLEVWAGERRLGLGGIKQRTVLAVLLAEADRAVSVDRLVDGVWGTTPPRTAVRTLRSYIANLRRLLEPRRASPTEWRVLASSPIGYRLRVRPEQIDSGRFTGLAESGRTALTSGRPHNALDDLDRALELWRGPAYAEFGGALMVDSEVARLEELRLTTEEERASAQIAAGRIETAISALRSLIRAEPLRERCWELLAIALYKAGRQGEALTALREARLVLDDALGVEPGPRLREVERAILEQRPDLDEVAAGRRVVLRAAEPAAETGSVLAGRDDVLAEVDRALAAAHGGRGEVLMVTGEPGIGKSRVAQEAAARADALGFTVAVGRCPDGEGSPALWPWVVVLRTVLGRSTSEVAGLADRLGLTALADGRGVLESTAPPSSGVPLPAALTAVLGASARHRPLLLVIEDLHWADADSVRVLRTLATTLPELPLLVIATSRDEADLSGPAAALVGGSAGVPVHRLALRRLTPAEVSLMLRGCLGAGADPETAGLIHRRCGGNPFHVVQLSRLLLESGSGAMAVALPQGTRDLIAHRLSRLDVEHADLVLVTASVIGEEFDFTLLSEAARAAADEVLAVLDAAVRWGLLAEAGPVGRYRFSHALVRDTLRGSVSRIRLARLHADVAAALESRQPLSAAGTGELLDAVAFHWIAAAPTGHGERAVTAAIDAAARAENVYAHEHSARLLSAAIDVIDHYVVPRTSLETRRLSEILVNLGRALCRGAAHEQASGPLHRAIGLAYELRDPVALAVAATVRSVESLWYNRSYRSIDETVVRALRNAVDALPAGDTPIRCLALAALAAECYFDSGTPREDRSRCSAQAVAMARRLGDDNLLSQVLHLRHQAIRHVGTLGERRSLMDEELALAARPEANPHWLPMLLLRRALIGLETGKMAAAQADIDACAAVNERVRLPEVEIHLRWWAALRAGLGGDTEAAERLGRQAYDLHRNTMWGADHALVSHRVSWLLDQADYRQVELIVAAERRPSSPIDAVSLGLALALQGRFAEALVHCPPAARLPDPPDDWLWLLQMVLRGYTWALCGDTVSSAWALERLLPYQGHAVTTGSAVFCWGSIDFFLGELAATAGNRGLAVTLMRQAIRHNSELGSRRWRERSESRLAQLTGSAGSRS